MKKNQFQKLTDNKIKNILICPLNWGLGHATRMIPVIECFKTMGANVIIAAYGNSKVLLEHKFPEIEIITLDGFEPHYPAKGSMALMLLRSFPKILAAFFNSRKQLKKIIDQKNIDIIISDNRYELYHKNVYSVFVTHQLNIKTYGWQRLFKPLLNFIINRLTSKFHEIWVPDLPSGILSGTLSQSHNTKVKYIGLLSRFTNINQKVKKDLDVVAIISGPEPQRTIFENMVLTQMAKSEKKCAIISGTPHLKKISRLKNVTIFPHLDDDNFARKVASAGLIISRPGYSTLMDLANFGSKAVFVPTPGQTEQIYLAEKLQNEGIAAKMNQDKFDLKKAIIESENYSGLKLNNNPQLLTNAINNLIIND